MQGDHGSHDGLVFGADQIRRHDNKRPAGLDPFEHFPLRLLDQDLLFLLEDRPNTGEPRQFRATFDRRCTPACNDYLPTVLSPRTASRLKFAIETEQRLPVVDDGFLQRVLEGDVQNVVFQTFPICLTLPICLSASGDSPYA